jgi:CPA1 family monovalent cation:H+ antiporter
MVVAGIMVGNWTRYSGFSKTSESFLDEFWHFLDEFLNALLFLLIGLAMMVVQFHRELMLLILFAIPLVLLARFVSVALPYLLFRCFRHYHSHSVRLLTWGGLRGALSLAMAISVPAGIGVGAHGLYDLRNVIVTMTYSVVLFSIIVQGMTVGPMIRRAKRVESENSLREESGESVPPAAAGWPSR